MSITVYLPPYIYLHISFFIYVYFYISTFVCQPLYVFVNFRIYVLFYMSPFIYFSPSLLYISLFILFILNHIVLYLCIYLCVFISMYQPLYVGVSITIIYLFNKHMRCRGLVSHKNLFFYPKYEVQYIPVYSNLYISHSFMSIPLLYIYFTPLYIPNSFICTLLFHL